MDFKGADKRKYKFIIEGKPKGKGRPRFARIGNYVRTYTPKDTQDYEEEVRKSFLRQCDEVDIKDYGGNIKVHLKAYFVPPKSTSKKKLKEILDKPYLHKPDCDNIAKIVLDSLNGIAFKDDNQVSNLKIEKLYGTEDRVEVEIEYMEDDL